MVFQNSIKHRRLACAVLLGAARSRARAKAQRISSLWYVSIILVRKDLESPVQSNRSLTGRFDVAT